MDLKEEIELRRAEIHSDGYPMSIGEILNLYRDGELDIHPEFQRFFRWDEGQKSRLVESLLLGIPIPSIFVSQRQDGVWDVIDGLQRLSTIFQLVGVLKDQTGDLLEPLVLSKTKYLPSLEGKKWEDEAHPENAIGIEHQLLIKRSKIDIKIILRESSESSKYELFQRLNTGGSQLTDQELRNCILITVNPDAYTWLTNLASDANFNTCVTLTDRAESEQYNIELIVRFLVFRRLPEGNLKGIGDIGEFLTDELVRLGESLKTDVKKQTAEEAAFKFTFEKLAETLGDDSFRRFSMEKGRYAGGFLLSAFEAIAMGVGYNFELYQGANPIPDIAATAKTLWQNEDFDRYTGSGVRASSRVPVIIPLGRRLFAQ